MSDLPGIDPDADPEPAFEQLPYVSKSRIKTMVQCPRNFFWKYWCDNRGPGSYYTERGTEVHETFEKFHENLTAEVETTGARPERFTHLLPESPLWSQWVEMVGEFFRFEERRWRAAYRSALDDLGPVAEVYDTAVDRWTPVEVEAEFWLGEPPQSWLDSERGGEPDYVSGEPPVGDIPWMGRADLIVDTRSLPEVEGDGVTIIDYKTGTPDTIKYEGKPWLQESLETGIFLEGEYYGWLAEPFYEVDAVAGYYPAHDELVVSTYPSKTRRWDIKSAVLGMQQPPDIENFETQESGLCHYNNSKNHGQCFFYPICEVKKECADCHPDTSGNGARYNP